MVGYLVDEEILVADGGRHLFWWARNRSSHRDHGPYYRRALAVATDRTTDLANATRMAAPALDEAFAGLPAPIAAQLQATMPATLPERLPMAAFAAAHAPRVVVQLFKMLPASVLRMVDLSTASVVAEADVDGLTPRAISADGRAVLATDYPGNRRWAVLDAEAGFAVVAEGALPPGAFFPGLAAWHGGRWWLALQEGRKWALWAVPAGGAPEDRLALPGAPGGLASAAAAEALAVGVGRERVLLFGPGGGKPRAITVFPDAPKHSAVNVALSPDGRRVLARSSLGLEVAAIDAATGEVVGRRPMPVVVEPWGEGAALHRLAGFAALDDRCYVLVSGQLQRLGPTLA